MFLIILLLYFPLGAYFFSFLILVIMVNDKNKKDYMPILMVFFSILIISFIINEISLQSFIINEDDFTTYYNNYIYLLNGDYNAIFHFGNGFEIGLPILNLIIANVLNLPYPYMVKTIYILIYIAMIISLTNKSAEFLKIKLGENKVNKLFLFLCYLLFLKLTMLLTIERQSIASYFVLLAVFSDNKKKYLWILIGTLFHLTTPIIYLLVNKAIKITDYKLLFKYFFVMVFSYVFINQTFNFIYFLLPNSKLSYVMFYMNDKELIDNERAKVIKEIIYIIPTILLGLVCIYKKIKVKTIPSVLFVILIMLYLSRFPGVPVRFFVPILFYMVGFYFYSVLKKFNIKYQVVIMIFFVFLFSLRIFNAIGYYSRYPMISFEPGYYIKYFFESKEYVDRNGLPKFEQINRINHNKL